MDIQEALLLFVFERKKTQGKRWKRWTERNSMVDLLPYNLQNMDVEKKEEASERVQVVLSVVEMVVVHGLEKIPIGDDAVAVHLSARDIHVEDTVGGK